MNLLKIMIFMSISTVFISCGGTDSPTKPTVTSSVGGITCTAGPDGAGCVIEDDNKDKKKDEDKRTIDSDEIDLGDGDDELDDFKI